MKRTCIFLVGLLWLAATTAYARTQQEAALVASQFMSHMGNDVVIRHQRAKAAKAIDKPVELAFTQYQIDQTTPAVYVFNSGDDGFVLVSAHDDTRAVLGYSDKGSFDAENMPANMQFWLQMYADEVMKLGDEAMRRKIIGERQEAKGERIEARSEEVYPTIAPILGNTIWGQDEPFNNKCPEISGQRTVTGCVATALAQIMYVHKHPAQGIGSHSYTTKTWKNFISANFGQTTYDWANMIPSYQDSYTNAQANAISTLMYHIGVASEMDYSTSSSGASASTSLSGIIEHFGYDKNIHTNLKNYMSDERIMQEIITDLQAGRPVYITGMTLHNTGHAFVCDGMQSDGYLHINWGWRGLSNGYFAFSALDPDVQGIGGSSSNMAYTESVEVYTNIKPDEQNDAIPVITIEKLERTSAEVIGKDERVGFSLTHFYNAGFSTAQGDIYYFIYDSNQEVVGKCKTNAVYNLNPGEYYINPQKALGYLPKDLSEGEYELEIRQMDKSGLDYEILVRDLGAVRIPLIVTNTQFKFGETPKAKLRPVVNADIINLYNTNKWNIDLYSKGFWVNTPSETEVLLRFTINSNSNTSVIGTYILDPTNSGATGTINADAFYAVGYSQESHVQTPSDMHLTIIPNNDGTLCIQYYLVVNGDEIKHSFTTQELRWIYKESGSNDLYYYTDYVTYEPVSTLSASKALELTGNLSHSEMTDMSYFVDGTISNMRNTASEIKQYKTARFDISDNGSTHNQFYCHDTKWLENTDFTTGNEIKIGDKVVILGQLQNYSGSTPEIRGYVYKHTPDTTPIPVDYSIKNLQLTTNQDTVFINFESEAPYFHIKVTKDDGTIAADDVIDFKNVFILLEDGNYTLWIRPVDEAQEYYLGDAIEANFTISTVTLDYSIRNLTVTTDGNTVFFSWESDAPYFHIVITPNNGTSIINTLVDFKDARIEYMEDGIYTLWIRPVDETQEYYLSDAMEATFTIETATDIETITSGEMIYLYDMLGRLVDSKMSDDPRQFDIPQSGVYIKNGQQVYIAK